MTPESRARLTDMRTKLATDKPTSHDSWPEPDMIFLLGIINELERKTT
jgi:hypothetical protein